MPIVEIQDLPSSGSLIGIDPGSKRIGIAVSDFQRIIASPKCVVKRTKRESVIDQILKLILEYESTGIVIGLPVNMNGTLGPRAQAAKQLANNIIAKADLPIAFQDERLTTAQAERIMLDAGMSRQRRSLSVDASAATIILQTVLDRLKGANFDK